MIIKKSNYRILTSINEKEIMNTLELFGRVSHKSENAYTGELKDSRNFIKKYAIRLKHETILEAYDLIIEFNIDRGISHELVRHRLTSPMQESTRYCNYSKDKFGNNISVIDIFDHLKNKNNYSLWKEAILKCEEIYLKLILSGEHPQIARSVLQSSLKTTVDVKANIREWRDILMKRTDSTAHPQMREVMLPLLKELKEKLPILFDDIK